MANMSEALSNRVTDGVTGVSNLFSPTVALALFTGDPTVGSNEVTAPSYDRLPMAGMFPAASGGVASNNAVITFATPTEVWGKITHIALCETAVKGTADYLMVSTIINPIDISPTLVFVMPAGNLTVTMD